jgi:hypothetical protein
MKTVLKFLTFGLILAAVGAISVTSTFAQATLEDCQAIYDQKFLPNRNATEAAKLEVSVNGGKEYLEKCKDLTGQEEVKAYVEKQLPKVIAKWEDAKYQEQVIKPFNDSVPAKQWDITFEKGKQVLAKTPDFVDVMLVLASIGFDTAAANNDKYQADTLSMAKLALQKMNEGKPSVTGDWGAFAFRYKTTKCPDGKVNATGWMNYTIGYIHFYRQKNQKEAAPYLYKATQVGCETLTIGDIYRMIGSYYIEEFKKLDDARIAALEKTKTTEKPLGEDTPETKAMLALERGYMERIVDAYYRASKLTTDPKNKEAWLTRAKEMYGLRFDKDMSGFDKWVADSSAKPFTDPTTAVTPVVVDETKATTTGMAPVSNDSTTASTTDTRPRTAPTTAATTPAKTTTTKKAPAKKPAPKKKGTR